MLFLEFVQRGKFYFMRKNILSAAICEKDIFELPLKSFTRVTLKDDGLHKDLDVTDFSSLLASTSLC